MRSPDKKDTAMYMWIKKLVQQMSQNGQAGPIGPRGQQGIQGIPGEKGIQGETGLTGAQGIKGDQGEQGIQGLKGDTGSKGDQGVKGDAGAQGVKGDKGDTGSQGTQGLTGTTGAAGDNRIKYAKTTDITSQAVGTYTVPVINLGANVFSNRPIVNITVETSTAVSLDEIRHVIGGNANTGFTLTITLTARKSTLDISLGALLGINLLASSIPALKLHVVAMEPTT